MPDLKQLYQALIMQHSQEPFNFCELDVCSHRATMSNPLCGDEITVEVRLSEGILDDISFQGNSCAICTASASMMTRDLAGMELKDADNLTTELFSLLDRPVDEEVNGALGEKYPDLLALLGVRHYPVRLQCAKLPWETLRDAVSNGSLS